MFKYNKKVSHLIINNRNVYLLIFLISIPSFGMGRTPARQAVGPDPEGWCYKGPADAPCGGAPGQCVINKNGLEGGFVAYTAFVESTAFIDRFARVCDTAQILDFAQILDEAVVSNEARVRSSARILNHARIFDRAIIQDDATIFGQAKIYQRARIRGSVQVSGKASIYGTAQLGGYVFVFGTAKIYGRAKIHGEAQISGRAQVFGRAQIFGDAEVGGNAFIAGTSILSSGLMVRGLLNFPDSKNPFSHQEGDPVPSTRADLMIELDNCGICQDELKSGDTITRLKCPCKVGYCPPCLAEWVKLKPTCPHCRDEICGGSLSIYKLIDADPGAVPARESHFNDKCTPP